MKRIDITGRRFGRLVVASFAYSKKYAAFWNCDCDCGNQITRKGQDLKSGDVRSCGCLKLDLLKQRLTKHGHTKDRKQSATFRSWAAMMSRCSNPSVINYENYGGRGITVCKRWKNSFAAFLKDMGERPVGMTLDRKNSNKNYTPKNCRWATYVEQNNNQRKRKDSK